MENSQKSGKKSLETCSRSCSGREVGVKESCWPACEKLLLWTRCAVLLVMNRASCKNPLQWHLAGLLIQTACGWKTRQTAERRGVSILLARHFRGFETSYWTICLLREMLTSGLFGPVRLSWSLSTLEMICCLASSSANLLTLPNFAWNKPGTPLGLSEYMAGSGARL